MKIYVHMEGGVIHGVSSPDAARLDDVQVVFLDEDVEGGDADYIRDVQLGDEKSGGAMYVMQFDIEHATEPKIAPPLV